MAFTGLNFVGNVAGAFDGSRRSPDFALVIRPETDGELAGLRSEITQRPALLVVVLKSDFIYRPRVFQLSGIGLVPIFFTANLKPFKRPLEARRPSITQTINGLLYAISTVFILKCIEFPQNNIAKLGYPML